MAETKVTGRTDATEEYESTGEMVQDVMPAVATAGIVALVNPSLLPGVAVGIGAMLLPKIMPTAGRVAGNIMRPFVKTAVKGGYYAYGALREAAAEATEQVQDIVAEVQQEQRQADGGRRRTTRAATRKAA